MNKMYDSKENRNNKISIDILLDDLSYCIVVYILFAYSYIFFLSLPLSIPLSVKKVERAEA